MCWAAFFCENLRRHLAYEHDGDQNVLLDGDGTLTNTIAFRAYPVTMIKR